MQVPSTADAARSHTRGIWVVNLDFSTPSRLITPEGYFGAGVTIVAYDMHVFYKEHLKLKLPNALAYPVLTLYLSMSSADVPQFIAIQM